MKLKIEKLYVNDKDKNGKPFISKKGQPYKKLSVFSEGKWYSGFAGKWNSDWKVGDEVEAEVEETQYNGTTFYNLKAPASGFNSQALDGYFGAINTKLDTIINKLNSLTPRSEEDIPF